MCSDRSDECHEAGDEQGRREENLSGPLLSDDAAGYLSAYVSPEEGAEDHMLHGVVPVELL